jgi:hypothetical protein
MKAPKGSEMTSNGRTSLHVHTPPELPESNSTVQARVEREEQEDSAMEGNGGAAFVGAKGYIRVKIAEKDGLGSGASSTREPGCWLPLSRTQTALLVAGVSFLFVIIVGVSAGLGSSHSAKSTKYGVLGEHSQCVSGKKGKPTLILISSDGFRWDYLFKVPTPNIDRLRMQGTETDTGMMPMYPSITFPNHCILPTFRVCQFQSLRLHRTDVFLLVRCGKTPSLLLL